MEFLAVGRDGGGLAVFVGGGRRGYRAFGFDVEVVARDAFGGSSRMCGISAERGQGKRKADNLRFLNYEP